MIFHTQLAADAVPVCLPVGRPAALVGVAVAVLEHVLHQEYQDPVFGAA